MKRKKLRTGIKKFFSVIIAVAIIMTGVFAQTEIASATTYKWMSSARALKLNQTYIGTAQPQKSGYDYDGYFYVYLPVNMNVKLTVREVGTKHFSCISVYKSNGERIKFLADDDEWEYNYNTKKSTYTKKMSLRKGGYYINVHEMYNAVWGESLTQTYSIKLTGTLTSTTRITGMRKLSGRNLKLAWKRMSGVSGYEVFRSTSKYGTYRKAATVSGIVYVNRNLTRNRTYYYKIRAFKKIGGKKYYAPSSAAKGIRM